MFKPIKLNLVRNCLKNLNTKNYAYISSTLLKSNNESNVPKENELKVPGTVFTKYEAFREDRAPIILDVEEERRRLQDGLEVEDEIEEIDQFLGIKPERGIEGVIDIEEAVDILRRENAQDIFVAEAPAEYRYVKYIVVVSGKSVRHMLGMAEFIRRVYKYKRGISDPIPPIEGKESKDWIALDLGNFALHIFSKSKREEYDLESLWSVGKEFDDLCNQPEDPLVAMLKNHSVLLSDLTPDDNDAERNK